MLILARCSVSPLLVAGLGAVVAEEVVEVAAVAEVAAVEVVAAAAVEVDEIDSHGCKTLRNI